MTCVIHGSGGCPCHGGTIRNTVNRLATTKPVEKEYAFEMASSNIRYGLGVTKEVGFDAINLGAKKVAVVTDANLSELSPVKNVIKSLEENNVNYVLFNQVTIEPTDKSFQKAIDFAKQNQPDLFIAVGGGSVIDTAKAANLYSCYPDADLLDFVNTPIGKGLPITRTLKPLIAVPTTAGTGSETTGTAIFDYTPLQTKTGIAHRNLKPLLGIVDPLNTRSMPANVIAASGLDVLCHSLESYTAIPYNQRSPRPKNPIERPAYQGANPISDIWSLKALQMCIKYLPRAFKDPSDIEASENMLLAATYAGIGFGNAGVHLCHGMSYPISGLNKKYLHPQYEMAGKPIIPHGISVAITSPSVFEFTADSNPERHLIAAKAFGINIDTVKSDDAGKALGEGLRKFLNDLKVPNGLNELGYNSSNIQELVKGTLPQHRVTKLAPITVEEEVLSKIFEASMKLY
ncbi:alcohol dehydrogenase, iron containing, 1, isoform CRA_b [Neoconidiobolus thromboides FSU 785]|nr:alcohol dehydrogenase, iron containing, 1, isoform CRA_b [Neoconidiobolus thromboides FSU 785]